MHADDGYESSELEMTAAEPAAYEREREQSEVGGTQLALVPAAATATTALEDAAVTLAATTAVQDDGDDRQEAQVGHKKKRRYGGIRLRAEKQQRKR